MPGKAKGAQCTCMPESQTVVCPRPQVAFLSPCLCLAFKQANMTLVMAQRKAQRGQGSLVPFGKQAADKQD